MSHLPTHLFNDDPTCRALPDGRFWIFGTHDQCSDRFQAPNDWWDNIYSYQAYSTEDFTTWVQHGSILSRFDIPWATQNAIWDGDAGIPANGRYYAYIPARCDENRVWVWRMAVLVADRPEGPYHEALGKPFLTGGQLVEMGHCEEKPGQSNAWCLSPTVIYDETGAPWLLFGQFRVFLAPLRPDMLGFSGPVQELDIPRQAGEATEFIEGPMLHQVGGRWVFSYMAYRDWQGKRNPNFAEDDAFGPYIQVCESDSMFGPFTAPRHWIYPLRPDDCNNQHAMAEYRGRWVAVYHVPWRQGAQCRRLCITEAKLDADGRLVPIHPGQDPGLGDPALRRVVYAADAKRFAQECHAYQGALTVPGPRKAHHLAMHPGGHLRFDDMDFGPVPVSRYIELDLLHHLGDCPRGRIEVRLDHEKGPVVATLELAGLPAADDVYQVQFVTDVVGLHNLYLTASCDPVEPVEAPALCRLLSFRIGRTIAAVE